MSPAGPLPTTAMRRPVLGARAREGHLLGLTLEVGGESLQRSDRHRVALVAQEAHLLALVVLRAYAPADGRQRVLLADETCGAGEVARGHQLHEAGDVDAHGATVDTRGLLALQAPARLRHGQLAVVAVADLLEVADAEPGVLLRLLLPWGAGQDLGARLLGHAVPLAVCARAAGERRHARTQRDVDGEDPRLAVVAKPLGFDQRGVTMRAHDVGGHRIAGPARRAHPLELLQPRVDEQVAADGVDLHVEADPDAPRLGVVDVERRVALRAEAREVALLGEGGEVVIQSVHRRLPTGP